MEYKDIWQKTLAQDEQIEFEFSISGYYRFFNLFIRIIIAFLISSLLYYFSFELCALIFLITIACLCFYYIFYLKISNAYAFTNRRVLIHRGWLSTDMKSVNYSAITDTTVIQPFFEWFLTSSGDLHIDTAGTPTQEIILRHIDRPYETKRKLEDIKNKCKD